MNQAPTFHALSVMQPWATLLVRGLKRFETRPWRFAGEFAGRRVFIHASANRRGFDFLTGEDRALVVKLLGGGALEYGALIGSVKLAAAYRMGDPIGVAPVSIRPASPPLGHFAAVAEASGARGVPLCILAALAESESSWRADARGKLGEVGLFQLTRGTWEWCGITRAQAGDPWANADCAARYVWAMRERFGDWQSALEAFKGGPLHVERGDVSPMAQRLALRVLERAEAYR